MGRSQSRSVRPLVWKGCLDLRPVSHLPHCLCPLGLEMTRTNQPLGPDVLPSTPLATPEATAPGARATHPWHWSSNSAALPRIPDPSAPAPSAAPNVPALHGARSRPTFSFAVAGQTRPHDAVAPAPRGQTSAPGADASQDQNRPRRSSRPGKGGSRRGRGGKGGGGGGKPSPS